VPAGCNNFLGGGLVGVVVVHFCFWWWLMVTLAGLLQFEIFFSLSRLCRCFPSEFSPAAMQSVRKCKPFAYTRGFRRSPWARCLGGLQFAQIYVE
jgi:hypothetical protein